MARAEITTPDALPDERLTDAALRPSRLDEFVGQSKVKESLQIAIDAAKHRQEPLDHALFFGPPGLGKTTLALLMAKELGVDIRTTSGPVLERPGDLVGMLTGLKRGDILFIAEVHRLRPALEESTGCARRSKNSCIPRWRSITSTSASPTVRTPRRFQCSSSASR